MRVKMKGTHEVFACSANPFTRDGAGKERSRLVKRYCALVLVVFVMLLLLPLPALDGGRLLFLLIELVIRRPVNPKYEGLIHTAGFLVLMGLMLVVTFNDLVRLF